MLIAANYPPCMRTIHILTIQSRLIFVCSRGAVFSFGDGTQRERLELGGMLAHLVRQVGSPVQLWVGFNEIASLVSSAIDGGGDGRHLCYQIQGVFIDWVPVLFLVDPFGVSCCKSTLWLQHTTSEMTFQKH